MARDRTSQVLDELHKTMKLLRSSLNGIPFRSGSFRNQHDNLARAVAALTVELDSARAVIK